MITEQEYRAAVAQHEAAEKVMHQYHKEACERFEARWERFNRHNEFFRDEDLVYAASACCQKCGAGLAYPKDCTPTHQWTCSGVLKGIGTDTGHDALPFAYYEIRSEQQPSANGATTRPKT